jgi:hypothetical protein
MIEDNKAGIRAHPDEASHFVSTEKGKNCKPCDIHPTTQSHYEEPTYLVSRSTHCPRKQNTSTEVIRTKQLASCNERMRVHH